MRREMSMASEAYVHTPYCDHDQRLGVLTLLIYGDSTTGTSSIPCYSHAKQMEVSSPQTCKSFLASSSPA